MKTERLTGLLRSVSQLQWGTDLARVSAQALTLLLLLSLFALGIDAMVGLKAWGLWALDLLLVGAACGAMIWLLGMLIRIGFHPRQLAVTIEQRLGVSDSRLINAVDLAGPIQVGASASLRERAVNMGDALAGTVAPGSVVDTDRLIRAGIITGAMLLVASLMYVLMPEVFHAVMPRLLAPGADHPPFTRLTFDVQIEPVRVYYGKPASIRAVLKGPRLPDRASVIFVYEEGARRRIPMVPAGAPPVSNSAQEGVKPGTSFLLRLDRVEQLRTFYIDTPRGRSKQYQLSVLPVPLFERVEVEYHYPAYTGWAPTKESLGAHGIRALVETEAALTVSSNRPLAGGELTLTPSPSSAGDVAESVALSPDPVEPVMVSGTATIIFSGDYGITLTGLDGAASKETLRGRVVALPDQLPQVRIVEPSAHVVAPEGWIVDVTIEVEDDIGIQRLLLHQGVNGWGPTPRELEPSFTSADRAAATAGYRFDLGELGARAGDVITYFAAAYDNHPSLAQFAETLIHVIQVISQDEYLEFARTRYRIDDLRAEWDMVESQLQALRDQRDQALRELEELLVELDRSEALSDDQRGRLDRLEAAIEQYSEEAIALFEDTRRRVDQPSLYDFEQPYKDSLRRLGMGLQSQAAAAAALRQTLVALRQADSPALRNQLGARGLKFAELQRPFGEADDHQWQSMSVDLERLELADELIGQAERIRLVVEAQQDLTQRMAVYRHNDRLTLGEQLRARRLAEEEAQLRRELADARRLLRNAAQLAQEKLPKMSSDALRICSAIDGLEVYPDLHSAERLANAGQGRGAYEAAQSAADKLDSLLSDVCTPQGAARSGDLDGCLVLPRFQLLNSLQQLAQSRAIPGLGSQGGTGGGLAGSMGRITVLGPASLGGGPSNTDWATRGGRGGRGPGRSVRDRDQSGAEQITAGAVEGQGVAFGALPGVPAAYRDEAEAYFRRLAEENR